MVTNVFPPLGIRLLGLAAVCIFACAPLCAAQEEASNPETPPVAAPPPILPPPRPVSTPNLTIRIVPVLHADPHELAEMVEPLGVRATPTDTPRAIVLAGSEEDVRIAQETLQHLDVAPPPVKNIEITLHMIVARKADPAAGTEVAGLAPCPPTLTPVTVDLAERLGFTQFGVLDTLLFRSRDEGEIESSGILPPLPQNEKTDLIDKAQYRFTVGRLSVQDYDGQVPVISLDGLVCSTEFSIASPAAGGPVQPVRPNSMSRMETGIKSDFDIREGQFAIVGKASVSGRAESIFLIVSARVLE